jgi:hypothetical protein
VLAFLPSLDLAGLEQGIQQFLDQLERVGERLLGDGDGGGLGVWLAAGVAAAVACEIGRRQLRRSEGRGQKSEVGLFPDL